MPTLHFHSAPKQYCDFPENVECGDRPLCDENDANCEERESAELPNDSHKSDSIVSDHVTTYAPLVPCPVDCPPDLVNVELEPCSSEYCTCTNGIGYLVVRKHNAITRYELLGSEISRHEHFRSARRASRSTRTSTRGKGGAIGPITTARTATIPNVQPKIVEML